MDNGHISVSKVLNILQLVQITKVPTAPEYMKGVINLRGTVLPIIDIRMKFGMDPIQYQRDTYTFESGSKTCYIVSVYLVGGHNVVDAVFAAEHKQSVNKAELGLKLGAVLLHVLQNFHKRVMHTSAYLLLLVGGFHLLLVLFGKHLYHLMGELSDVYH